MHRPRDSRKLLDEILDPVILGLSLMHFALTMYGRAMVTSRPQDDPYLRPWKVAKDATLLLVLVLMYLQFYYMDVLLQIETLPRLRLKVPLAG